MRIIGVLLVLLGLALVASPEVRYSTRERLGDTSVSVKREKTIVIPRVVSALIIAAGVTAVVVARKT